MRRRRSATVWLASCAWTAALVAAGEAGAQNALEGVGMVERIQVHGPSLEGNLSGDSPVRNVTVYLPPGYHENPDRRYPVVYMLHGYTDTDAQWMGFEDHWINLPVVLNRGFQAGRGEPFIVVMPDAFTRFHGSMYSSSVTTGDWESFIARDLVAYIDANYRTIPETRARGIAGHSMGGYGAIRIGMRHPEVFAAVYALSPCCMSPPTYGASGGPPPAYESVTSVEEIDALPFGVKAAFASAAAWAPNPANPPFYLDLPTRNGEPRQDVLARYAANSPLAMVDQYIFNLRRLSGFAVDSGDRDFGIAQTVVRLHEILEAYDYPHFFEIYDGDHLSGIAERIETKMLPFFTEHLWFGEDD